MRPAAHTTLGGICVKADCSTAVPGLFAAGEAVGNLHGKDRLGGNAGLEVFVFGRIAGGSAGKFASGKADFEEFAETPSGRSGITTDILDRYFTVLPDENKLKAGLKELEAMPQNSETKFLKQIFSDKLKTL